MNARRALLAVVAALAALFAWMLWPGGEAKVHRLTLHRPAAPFPASHPTVAPRTHDQSAPEPRSELADQLNAPTGNIHADLRIVREIVDTYRSNFHENPVGTNAEITAVLVGHNSLQLALIPPNFPAVNLRGELCDRWGRPLFFHQLSGTQMEIRSSGPDRKMWNEDDVVLTP
jgi:hypothetical protein